MINTLAAVLRRAGLAFTISELEDIVWLADKLDSDAGAAPAAAPAPDVAQPTPSPAVPLAPPAAADAGTPEDDGSDNDADARLALRGQADLELTIDAGVMRVPGVAGTGAPEHYRRALQPFARRVESRWDYRLDELATAVKVADTGLWIPVMQAARERCFDLALVIEDCAVAHVRRQALADMTAILRSYSGLRSVTAYTLEAGDALRLTAVQGHAQYGIAHLLRSDTRQLVLFATDGTSARWRDGSAHAFLHALGAVVSVSIVHLLPQPTWRHTAIGNAELKIHAPRPGERNRGLQSALPWWANRGKTAPPLLVPVIGMDAGTTSNWARTMSARGGAFVPGVLVASPEAVVARAAVESAAAPSASPAAAARVARYRNMVSKSAYDLAVFLSSVDPLTVSVIRVIQRSMLPATNDAEVAEFIAGGLVGLVDADLQHNSGRERQYRFHPGIAEELQKSLRDSERNEIGEQLARVGRFIENNQHRAARFEALFPMPSGAARLSEWALPFAEVSRQVMREFAERTRSAHQGAWQRPRENAEPGGASPGRRLRVLHLNDLHMGAAADSAYARQRPELTAAWASNLATIRAHGGVDMVFVSGDLTWTGAADEFEEVSEFFDQTLALLALDKSRLFVVPGNHDVKRLGSAATQAVLRAHHADEIARARHTVERAQANYRAWLARYHPALSMATAGPQADFRVTLDGWAMPVHVLGLDTEWLGDADGNTPRATPNQLQQLLTAADGTPLQGVILALGHHAPDARDSQTTVREGLARAGVSALMLGQRKQDAPPWKLRAGTMFETCGRGLSLRGEEPMHVHVVDLELMAGGRARPRMFWTRHWERERSDWISGEVDYWDQDGQLVGKGAPAPLQQAEQEAQADQIFVGRDAELDHLTRLFTGQRQENGLAPHCLVMGVAGIGKTALAGHFAWHVWTSSSGIGGRSIRLTARREGRLVDQLDALIPRLEAPDSSSFDRQRHLLRYSVLVIIDDLDSAQSYDDALDLCRHLPNCPVLMAGRYRPPGDHVTKLELGSLAAVSSRALLMKMLPRLDIAAALMARLIDALAGNPAMLRLAAARVVDGDTSESILHRWADLIEPDVTARYAKAFAHWSEAHDHKPVWRDALVALACGPSDCSAALGAAVSGFVKPSEIGPVALDEYAEFLASATEAGLIDPWSDMPTGGPSRAWLGTLSLAMAPRVRQRWHSWIRARLKARKQVRTRAWIDLDENGDALVEWLAICSHEDGAELREIWLDYASKNGASAPFIQACNRFIAQSEVGSAEARRWHWALALLLRASDEDRAALAVIEAQKLALPSGDWSIRDAAQALDLRNRLAHGYTEPDGMAEAGTVAATGTRKDQWAKLRPHQKRLAEIALASTISARNGDRRAGIVRQVTGSGASQTLGAYLTLCRASHDMPPQHYVVIVPNQEIAAMTADSLRAWASSDDPGSMPGRIQDIAIAPHPRLSGIFVGTPSDLRKYGAVLASLDSVLVFDNVYKVAPEMRASFPKATLLAMTPAPLYIESELLFGPEIGAYEENEAIPAFSVRRVSLDSQLGFAVFAESQRTAPLSKLVAEVLCNELVTPAGLIGKCVVVVEDERTAQVLNETAGLALRDALHAHGYGNRILVAYVGANFGSGHVVEFKQLEDGNGVLIVDRAILHTLDLRLVRTCYVCCTVSLAMEKAIVSFVTRPNGGADAGEIVDFAGNSWRVAD